MKILLVAVNAKYIHSNLAVHCLRAYAKEYQSYIQLAEYTINHNPEDILSGIYKEQADIIAFSCYIWNFDIVTRLIVELRKLQPDAKIWFGGPEVSYDPTSCLSACSSLDGIMIGEGEQTFLELTKYYVDFDRELEQIPGLAFKDSARVNNTSDHSGTGITCTMDRQPISLDAVPFPYEAMEEFRNKIIYYESSRGCPFSCSYCLSSIDKRVRLRSLALVKKELAIFLEYKVPQVKFVDRTFNCSRQHALEIWRFIKENDNGITNFHFEISADLLDDEELELLATLRPGQVQFEIGVQTTNTDTVVAIHRTTDFHKLSRSVARVREGNNIHQHLDLIAGLPKEGLQAFQKSYDDVYRLVPDQLQLGFLKVLKGSLMEEECASYGIVHQDQPPYEVLYTRDLSYSELLVIKGVCEMTEVYYNSGQFKYAITFLEHFYSSPFRLYEELSNYYEGSMLNQVAHNRIRRYEILLDFYKEVVLKLVQEEERHDLDHVFQELLTLDLYLREDMKSRPQFLSSKNNPDYKDSRKIYDYYEVDRRTVHLEHFSYDVFASCVTGQAVKKDCLILFDYSRRDPLNRSANLIHVKQELYEEE